MRDTVTAKRDPVFDPKVGDQFIKFERGISKRFTVTDVRWLKVTYESWKSNGEPTTTLTRSKDTFIRLASMADSVIPID